MSKKHIKLQLYRFSARVFVSALILGTIAPFASAASREFAANMSPTTYELGATSSYTITITNSAANGPGEKIGSVLVTIPAGWIAESPVVPAGWNVEIEGPLIKLNKTAGNQVTPGESVAVTFNAVAPEMSGSYEWTIQAFQGTNWNDAERFTLTSSQPTLTNTSGPPVSGTPITTYTLTYTASANGTVTGSTDQVVNSGADGTAVTAVPDTGFHFVNWNDDSTSNPRTDTNVTSDQTFIASFAADSMIPATTYTLTYTASANGTVTGSTDQVVNSGADGTAVTAVPDTGFHFANWDDLSTNNPRTDLAVAADITVMAIFAENPVDSRTLTYAAGPNGTLTGNTSQSISTGADGTAVTAVPNSGFHFVNWNDDSTSNPRTDTNVTADISVMANFAEDALTATTGGGSGGGGGGSGASSGRLPGGSGAATLPSVGQVLGVSTTTVSTESATTTGQVLGASCGLYIDELDKPMKRGSSRNSIERVKKLQDFLKDHGFHSVSVTGYFGAATEAAVRAFQAQYSDEVLKPWEITAPTGFVYLTTIRQINLIQCPEVSMPTFELIPWSGDV